VRHATDAIREQALISLVRKAEEIAKRRGLAMTSEARLNQHAVAMDPFLIAQIEDAIRKTGCQPHRMVSGAGHDAMILAEKVPAAMIFLRSPGGISHDPAEAVQIEDVAKALECGIYLLDQLAEPSALRAAQRTMLQTRTLRA
jgi:allantoate deiminase